MCVVLTCARQAVVTLRTPCDLLAPEPLGLCPGLLRASFLACAGMAPQRTIGKIGSGRWDQIRRAVTRGGVACTQSRARSWPARMSIVEGEI